MPRVEQYDWSKLKPATPFPRQKQGTKQFATHEYKEPHKNSKHGAVKIARPPKKKRIKAVDPDIRHYHDNALRNFFKNL